jgi:hypothetical protein
MHVCLCPLVSVMTLGLCCHRVDAWEETTMKSSHAVTVVWVVRVGSTTSLTCRRAHSTVSDRTMVYAKYASSKKHQNKSK